MTPREHALKVAVLGTLLDEVKAAYTAARKEAEGEFAGIRKDGTPQQKVMLPDGDEIGLISIRAGTSEVVPDSETALMDWCRDHFPQAIEQYVIAGATDAADVIEVIAALFPHQVKDRIRASHLAVFHKQIGETGGYLINEDGEKAKVATVDQRDPSGAFSYRPAKGAQDRIMREWQAGNLREVALGPLALPAETPEPEPGVNDPGGPFFAEDGHFRDPVSAALHATYVQGGSSTPEREAARMIRDGGPGEQRARAWMAGRGYTEADLEGLDA